MESIETIEHNNKTIHIAYDDMPESPREWDNLGTFALFHNRYTLANEEDLSIEETQEIAESNEYLALNVYMYDHSGIALSCSPFSCPWDSGQVGIIYISKEKIRKEYNVKRISKQLKARIFQYLESEVAVYSSYLNGEIYSFFIEDEIGEIVDSCGGFYSLEDAKSEALNFIA